MVNTKKIALVTGANKGLGYQTAKQLAQLGMKVLLGVRDKDRGENAEKELRKEKLDVQFIQLDVSDENSIVRAKEKIEKEFSKLDVLINNAGIMPDLGKLLNEVTVEDIQETFTTNVIGVMITIKHFLPLLEKSEAGRIVNVSSGLGSLAQNADPNYEFYPYKLLAYNSSKAALNSVTLTYAYALKNTKIKINSADPGFCKTDLNGNIGPKAPEQGAKISVKLATLDGNGPHGGFFDCNGIVPW